ncbi:MAG: hypothetical protein MRY63_11415 [Neomegalonema sp.]|nr:hypothetical protein [Neomegalonema sp.]
MMIFNRPAFLLRAAVIGLALCLVQGAQGRAADLVIGQQPSTEHRILAEITRQVLTSKGIGNSLQPEAEAGQIRKDLLAGDVDIAWDSTWQAYTGYHGASARKTPDAITDDLRQLDRRNGLVWLNRSQVNSRHALAVNLDVAAEICLRSMEDLASLIRNGARLRLASDQACAQSADCLPALQRAYGFTLPKDQVEILPADETTESLRNRSADIAVITASDGRVAAYDLEILTDDRGVIADQFLLPVIRAQALATNPAIEAVMNRIVSVLDTEAMQDLQYRIDVIGQPVEAVARYFIASQSL